MKLKDIGEFGFIDRIRRGCLVRPEGVLKAIGDDCAALIPPRDRVMLFTTDLLVERVHFLRTATTGFNLGYKALAVNLSDIAAMGGVPREAFVSIAIPADCDVDFLESIYAGIRALAGRFDVNILGGDTTGAGKDLIINIGVLGSVSKPRMLSRDGARVGDVVCTSGYLGESRAGLHLILNAIDAQAPALKPLFDAHVRPKPHVDEGHFLAATGAVHAAIDISDGLSSDLSHVVAQSRVGACIYDQRLPVSEPLRAFCQRFGFDASRYALAGGEDYVLLVTISPDQAEQVCRRYEQRFGTRLFPVGEITDTGRMERVLADGRSVEIEPSGWDHFKLTLAQGEA